MEALTLFDASPDFVVPELPHEATLQERFDAWHQSNPWVADRLQTLAGAWPDANISLLFELLRYHWKRTRSDDQSTRFVLNNDFRAFYARLLMDRDERLHFTTREQRAA